jgi:carboxylesterase
VHNVKRVLQGGEPFFFPGDDAGCLLIHGFTATPQEMRWLGEYLADKGRTVLGVRLFAHATDVKDMPHARWRDWLASAEDGYYLLRSICSRIVILGLSLGGAISLYLSSRLPVNGVVAMSTPNQLPSDPRIRLLRPIIRPLSLIYPYNKKGPPDFLDPAAREARVQYHYYPLRSVVELDIIFSMMRHALPDLDLPVLFIHSEEDRFVPPNHMHANFALLGSEDKEEILIKRSNHIITCDSARMQVFSAAAEFVERVTG